jgi:hypothetical protein
MQPSAKVCILWGFAPIELIPRKVGLWAAAQAKAVNGRKK